VTYGAHLKSAEQVAHLYVPMTSPGKASVILSLSCAKSACAEERLIVRFMRLCPTFMPFLKVPERDAESRWNKMILKRGIQRSCTLNNSTLQCSEGQFGT
jgi:hypothetical protein